MGLSLVTFLLFSGFCTPPTTRASQYYFINATKTWTEAQSHCREKFADLATVENSRQLERLVKTVGDVHSGAAWIGLYRDTRSWRWSQSGEETSCYRNWDDRQPDSEDRGKNCAMMTSNGRWSSVLCNKPRHYFFCFDGNTTSQDPYVPIKQEKTWKEAQQYCREHHTDLVSVRNQSTNDHLQVKAEGTSVWIGLTRVSWKWSDGSSSRFRFWSSAPPEETPGNDSAAVALFSPEKKGAWDSKLSHERHPFVCYDVTTGKKTIVGVKISTAGDIRDASFSDHLLQQLREELIARGMSEGTRLRWRQKGEEE